MGIACGLAMPAGCGGGVDGVAPLPPPPPPPPPPAETVVPTLFEQVRTIVQNRCVACHAQYPSMPGFSTAPLGIRFDTDQQIRSDARRIYVNVVQTEFMPYGNRTNMTSTERAVIARWYETYAQSQ